MSEMSKIVGSKVFNNNQNRFPWRLWKPIFLYAIEVKSIVCFD